MKKSIIMAALCIISCAVMTGCYPTGKKEDIETFTYDGELNESPREGLVYKFTVPEEYPETYSVTRARDRNFDPQLLEVFFPDCKKDTTDIVIDEAENYTLYQKADSHVVCWDGRFIFRMLDEETNLVRGILKMPIPNDEIRSIVPNTEFKKFSADEHIKNMQHILDTLEVEVSEPYVYAVGEDDEKYLRENFFGHWNDRKILEEDTYIVLFDTYLDGLPVVKTKTSGIMRQEWLLSDTEIYGSVTNDGLRAFIIYNAIEVSGTGDEEKICSPEYAVQQIKNYIEGTSLSGTMCGCELKALAYFYEGEEHDDYMVKPVWEFGWKEGNYKYEPYFVDAVTGNVYY